MKPKPILKTVSTDAIKYMGLAEMIASIKVLATEGEATGRAASGKWALLAHSFAHQFTEAKPAGPLIGDLYRASLTKFLDSALGDDKQNAVRHNGQKQLSASLKIVRDADLKLAAPLYVWAAKKIKASNTSRETIAAWVRGASDLELVHAANMLPEISDRARKLQAAALASLTPEVRSALGF